jgi:hypothetical protein
MSRPLGRKGTPQMAQETISAAQLAIKISKALGRTVSPKQVRGRVRGDAGTPLLSRYGAESRSSYASHVYTMAEANKIGQAFVDAHNKRNATSVRWSAIGARKPKVAPKVAATPTSNASGQES